MTLLPISNYFWSHNTAHLVWVMICLGSELRPNLHVWILFPLNYSRVSTSSLSFSFSTGSFLTAYKNVIPPIIKNSKIFKKRTSHISQLPSKRVVYMHHCQYLSSHSLLNPLESRSWIVPPKLPSLVTKDLHVARANGQISLSLHLTWPISHTRHN